MSAVAEAGVLLPAAVSVVGVLAAFGVLAAAEVEAAREEAVRLRAGLAGCACGSGSGAELGGGANTSFALP